MDKEQYSMGEVYATVDKIRVRVLDVYEYVGRKKALVRATHGDPFIEWTHGGWAYTSHSRVPVEFLKDVASYECTCLPDLPDGRVNGGRGTLCPVCTADSADIPFEGSGL